MIRQTVSALVLAVATLAPIASHAADVSMFGHDTTTAPKGKMVKMTLKNRTASPMDLMIEDKAVTFAAIVTALSSIAANGEYELKAVEGTRVYGSDKAVKVLVTRDLNGTTCSFR